MRKLILLLIRFYQKFLSLDQGLLGKLFFIRVRTCRFRPACSEYTYRAVAKYGALKGLYLGLGRVIRCNPLSKGGRDPLP